MSTGTAGVALKSIRHRYRVTALAPVHVGNGQVLAQGLDYISDGERTWFVDVEQLFSLLSLSPATLDEFVAGRGDLFRTLERMRVRPERIARWTAAHYVRAPRVQECSRDALGRPILPGSALKGALRTLIVWALAFDFDEKARDWVSSREMRAVLESALAAPAESGPGHLVDQALLTAPSSRRLRHPSFGTDLLRCLGVADCRFAQKDLEVAEARILTATPDGPAFKSQDRRGRPRPRPGDPAAESLGVEALRAGGSAETTLRFDGLYDLLRGEPVGRDRHITKAARVEIDFEPWRIDIPFQISVHSRNLGLYTCYRERLFYEERKLYDLARFYIGLEEQIHRAAGTETIFARVGWGSGWEGMTGGVVSGRARDRARERFHLGREGFPFPKTRKLVFSNNKLVSPFGWVRFDPL